MKRIALLATALVVGFAAIAAPVTPQRAKRVAGTVLQKSDAELVEVGEEIGFQHLFCFNQKDGEGFVVVSSDDCLTPVIAFSEEGSLDLESLNPSARWWLGQYDVAVELSDKETDPVIAKQWKDLEQGIWAGNSKHDMIPSLLDGISWNQGAPYNMLCPGESVTGCVATAYGQIMRYWKFPEHGWGSHSYTGEGKPIHYPNWSYGTLSADFEHTYYDWEHMPKVAYINSSDSEKVAVATLLYHIGVALDMNYSPDGSMSWSLYEYSIADGTGELDPKIGSEYRIPKFFGYRYDYAGMRDSIGDDARWNDMLYQSLAEGKPIYYAGWSVDSTSPRGYSTTSGHGFVIDGYRDGGGTSYYRLNWGWGGSSDGWFTIDNLRPRAGVGSSARYDFTQWHGAVIGLEPDSTYNGGIPSGITRPYTQQGSVMGLTGAILVRDAANSIIEVYDMMGRRVAKRDKSAEKEWLCSVKRGIYVVRIGNGKGMKILSH